MNDLLETLLTRLAAGESVVRAAIVAQEGSAPRAAGALMLVFADKTIAGTVGGGLVEARVMDAAAVVLAEGLARVMDFNLTGEMAAGADMICGGRLRIFLERLDPDQAGEFIALRDRLAAGERCLLATPLDAPGSGGGRILLAEDGSAVSPDVLPWEVWDALHRAGENLLAPACVDAGGRRYVLEPCQGRPRLFLMGAGHVSRATALAAGLAGYSVTVLDDRLQFANRERFPTALEAAVADLTNCFAGRTITPRDMVVIVTRGHLHDAVVLAQTLATPAGYVGMIGSRRKRDAIYDRLRAAGTTDAELARVHCPVGLPSGAETPAKANGIRARRIEGREDSNVVRREKDRAAREAEAGRWTIRRLWQEYKASRPNLKGIVSDENRFKNFILPAFGDKEPCQIISLLRSTSSPAGRVDGASTSSAT